MYCPHPYPVVPQYQRQRLLLRPERGYHSHGGVLREPREQLVHHSPYGLGLRPVVPGLSAAATRRLAVRYVHPAQSALMAQ